jgi:hypothetical protein
VVKGYAGNSAPDHVDQLHALPTLLSAQGASRATRYGGTRGSTSAASSSVVRVFLRR